MSALSESRVPLLVVLALLILCAWPLATGLGQVISLNGKIAAAQGQAETPAQEDPKNWVVPASGHGAAGAALQARLRATARKSDLSLTRVEVEPRDVDDPTLLQLQARAEGSVRAVAQFLHELESTTPVLVIHAARLTGEDGRLSLDMQVQARTVPEMKS